MTTEPNFTIDVVSDVACPWCYIGYKRLKRILELDEVRHLPMTFDLHFKPYFIMPDLGDEPTNRKQLLDSKYIGSGEASRQRISREGEKEGITFNWSEDAVIRSTRNAHRLLLKVATEQGNAAQEKLNTRLYQAYNEECLDVGDPAVLARLASDVEVLSESDAQAYLESDDGNYELDRELLWPKFNGIEEVPFFLIDDERFHLSGAASEHEWLRTFDQLKIVNRL